MKLLPSVCIAAAAAAGGGWSYPEDGGNWGDSCRGQEYGSPINFDYTYRNFKFEFLNYFEEGAYFGFKGYENDRNWHMTDNGHSIVFTVADDDHHPEDIQVYGGHLGRAYNFHSFHFHWGNRKMEGGSEHTVNGRHTFAELHMVHTGTHCGAIGNCASFNETSGEYNYPDGLAVLGAFVEVDKNIEEGDVNEVIKRILNKAAWLNNAGIDDQDFTTNGNFALFDMVGHLDPNAFYRYQGSLTTPGCNEVVRWTVFKDTIKINRRFARRFLHTVGDGRHADLQDNFRGVQDLAGREVTFWSADQSASKMIFHNERRWDNGRKRRPAPQRKNDEA